jgi:hypothetical protein
LKYEKLNPQETNEFNFVNQNNLKRIIRVRNILKHKRDSHIDNIQINNLEKFKEEKRKNEGDLVLALDILGPPKFIKTQFLSKTINKYKMLCGKFFSG